MDTHYVEANERVAALSRATGEVATGAIGWFHDNTDKVRQERASLMREFRKFAQSARKLEVAAHRPMCVGVFGPSQAGKSYLISALARRGTAPLMAEFEGQPDGIDFVREINPEGGQESTGLVTRFTIRREKTPPGYPVALRLLSQTDVAKILGNTYLSDLDVSEHQAVTPQKIRELIEMVRRSALANPVDHLTEDDVFEMQEYFEKQFKGLPLINALSSSYWAAAAELAPRLPIGARAALFSVLWGEIEPFTDLFKELYGALNQLGFPTDAYCPLDALIPREKSVIDVVTLGGLGHGGAELLEVLAPDGRKAMLPRPDVTALIAELRIVMKDKPWDFFDHTDLLDFPGARSRENIEDVEKFLQQADALKSLFLRGKVAYLFERYCAEQELTSMLLCIGPSNQEVRTLPAMIKDWIDSTHGPDPADRERQENALFLVLTKFDTEFSEKAGESASSIERWSIRLNASLLDFFGKAHDWPREWTPGQPFRNSFWMRNPNYRAKEILEYDADGVEIGIRQGEENRIRRFQEDYLSNPLVQNHFNDPTRAWDEAFRLNDGGITYLAQSLAPVCNPDIKRRQIEARIGQQRGLMRDRLARYYVSGDLDEEMRKRKAMAALVVRHLANCVEAQRFGHLLKALQVTDAELADLYYDVEMHGGGVPAENGEPARPVVAIGRPVTAQKLLEDVFGDEDPVEAEDAGDVAPPEPGGLPVDKADLFADAVLQHWISEIRAASETPRMCTYFRVSEASMSALASELISGAQRLDIRSDIAESVRRTLSFRQKIEQARAKAALLAANILNAYVNWLGFDKLPLDERPTAGRGENRRSVFSPRQGGGDSLTLPEQPTPYDEMQYVDWMTAFRRLVEDNASSRDGAAVDVEQNARLGKLVVALERAA